MTRVNGKGQKLKGPDRFYFFTFTFTLLPLALALSACGHFMHPKASEYLKQAQGSSGLETMINLTGMLERSVIATREADNFQAGLDDLHNQLHALKKSFCLVTEAQARTPAYAKAVTIRQEMRTVFHRLWKYRSDPVLRGSHLDLFATRVQELRDALQAVKG